MKPILRMRGSVEYDLAVVGGAGVAGVVKQSYSIIEEEFARFFDANGRNPNDAELRNIAESIQLKLLQKYQQLRSLGVEANTSLIVATVSSGGNPHIYLYENGLLEDRSEDGYAMIGVGKDTGGTLLLKLLGYDPGKADWNPAMVTTFLIDAISSVNPYVSPLTDILDNIYIRFENNRVMMGPLEPTLFLEIKEKVRRRIDIIRKLWQAMEVAGENKVEKALNRIIKQAKQ